MKNNDIIIRPTEWVKLRLGKKLIQEDINKAIEKYDKNIVEEEYPEIKRWKKKEWLLIQMFWLEPHLKIMKTIRKI